MVKRALKQKLEDAFEPQFNYLLAVHLRQITFFLNITVFIYNESCTREQLTSFQL
jgi:hypothetical protein